MLSPFKTRELCHSQVTSFGPRVPLRVGKSPRGRGVFAGARIEEGQEVEVCGSATGPLWVPLALEYSWVNFESGEYMSRMVPRVNHWLEYMSNFRSMPGWPIYSKLQVLWWLFNVIMWPWSAPECVTSLVGSQDVPVGPSSQLISGTFWSIFLELWQKNMEVPSWTWSMSSDHWWSIVCFHDCGPFARIWFCLEALVLFFHPLQRMLQWRLKIHPNQRWRRKFRGRMAEKFRRPVKMSASCLVCVDHWFELDSINGSNNVLKSHWPSSIVMDWTHCFRTFFLPWDARSKIGNSFAKKDVEDWQPRPSD